MKKILFTILLLLPLISFAQNTDVADQFGNFLRESGKLYVVFAVIIIIFAAIIIILIRQEMKLNKLEKKITSTADSNIKDAEYEDMSDIKKIK